VATEDVPGQTPLFDATPLPPLSGVSPPVSGAIKRQRLSQSRREAFQIKRTPRVHTPKTRAVLCHCPKCGHDFLKDV
jgi:hypothetical protein